MIADTTDFTITNCNLVEVSYSTVITSVRATNNVPFRMTIRCPNEWAAIVQCVNQGIDAHLEAINHAEDVFDNSGRCSVTPHSLCVLLRRLGDTEFKETGQETVEAIWDAAMSLQSGILAVLGINEFGEYVGREALGLE